MATSEKEPPLVVVNNPVTYLRLWWQKVMGKEGIDLSFKIHPITAVLMVAVASTIGFGAGRFTLPDEINIPFFKFGDDATTTPSSLPETIWKETAFIGKLQYSLNTSKFFLITTSSEAITLDVPQNLDLLTLVGKRIMAVGQYNKLEKKLKVFDAKDLEILPKTPIPVPTIESIVKPEVTMVPTSTPMPEFKNNQDNDQGGGIN